MHRIWWSPWVSYIYFTTIALDTFEVLYCWDYVQIVTTNLCADALVANCATLVVSLLWVTARTVLYGSLSVHIWQVSLVEVPGQVDRVII